MSDEIITVMGHRVPTAEVDGIYYQARIIDANRLNFFSVKHDGEYLGSDAWNCWYTMQLDILLRRYGWDRDPSFTFDPDIVF